jgi:hypothetical protein
MSFLPPKKSSPPPLQRYFRDGHSPRITPIQHNDRVPTGSTSSGSANIRVSCRYLPRGRQLESITRLSSHEPIPTSGKCVSWPDHIWNHGTCSCAAVYIAKTKYLRPKSTSSATLSVPNPTFSGAARTTQQNKFKKCLDCLRPEFGQMLH